MAIKQCHCDLTPYLKTEDLDAQATALGYIKTNKPEYKLPYTASELLEKLSAIGNETVSDGGEADGN